MATQAPPFEYPVSDRVRLTQWFVFALAISLLGYLAVSAYVSRGTIELYTVPKDTPGLSKKATEPMQPSPLPKPPTPTATVAEPRVG